jgi:hypothetical protein
VDEHHRSPVVEFGEQRFVPCVAEVGTVGVGLQGDSVGAEDVERVGQLGQCAVHVRQRQRREVPEPARAGSCDRGSGLVDLAGQMPCGAVSPRCTPGEEIDK